MQVKATKKVFVPKKNPNKPVTIRNNDKLILIKQSKYLDELTKGEK
jgi:hypothetical protein